MMEKQNGVDTVYHRSERCVHLLLACHLLLRSSTHACQSICSWRYLLTTSRVFPLIIAKTSWQVVVSSVRYGWCCICVMILLFWGLHALSNSPAPFCCCTSVSELSRSFTLPLLCLSAQSKSSVSLSQNAWWGSIFYCANIPCSTCTFAQSLE